MLRALMDRAQLGFVTGLTAEARLLRGSGFTVAAGGGTPKGAEAAAKRLIAGGATGLVSFGLCGGLDPALPAGALVIPAAVIHAGKAIPCDAALLARLGGATVPRLVAGAAIAVTAADKVALFVASGAAAIDLESGAVAASATAAGLPFAVLRAVSDPASRDLPPAALLALDAAGGIDMPAILASLARRPGQIASLLMLARDAARARRTLRQALRRFAA